MVVFSEKSELGLQKMFQVGTKSALRLLVRIEQRKTN